MEGIGRRIIEAVKRQIHGGTYQPGDRLPSSRAFAAEWGVSRTTVTAAYGQLVAEGYLLCRPGARPTVAAGLALTDAAPSPLAPAAGPLSAYARRLRELPQPAPAEPVKLADFRYGDLSGADFPVLAWRRALTKVSLRRRARLRYADPQGDANLRAALQGHLWRARGVVCTPDEILIVNGSQQGLDLCARLLLDPGDSFLIENPGYALARHAFLAAGGIPIPIPVDSDGIRADALPAGRLAYVTPSHQFPLGSVLSATRRRTLLAWASACAAYIVEDDYDSEYRHDIAPIPPLRTLGPHAVIYAGTFSKTLSPTLRLGYLVLPPGLVEIFRQAKRVVDRHAPLLEQEALAELLASGAYERHVRGIRRRNAERRAALLDSLDTAFGAAVTVEGAGAGLHVVAWLRDVPARRCADLVKAARAAGLGLYPVSALYDPAMPEPGITGLVLGYSALDTALIHRGVALLAGIVADLSRRNSD